MAKYQRYAEYQDSGVEWLGEVPSHWDVIAIKYIANLNPKKSEIDLKIKQGKCSFIPMDKLKLNSIQLDEVRDIRDVFDGYTYFKNNDVLMAKVTPCFENKNIAVASNLINGLGFGSSEIYVFRTYYMNSSRFLYYRLQENNFMDIATASMIGAGGLKRIPAEIITSYSIAKPSRKEQTQISNFLDHETAKIDSLIEKQKKLIELLKEKRQAVISHAVTKGLNPDVPMKDSGVEWLGEVPEHWVTSRLKYYTNRIVDGAHFTPTYSESGVPFLRVTDIHNDCIDMENIKYIPESEHQELIQRCKPEKGDLLLSKNGTIGVPKLITWDWEFSIFVSLCLIKFKKRLMAEFAEYFFKSYEIQEQIFGLIKKSTVINLHLDKIQNFWFSIPPIKEQQEIVNFLNKKLKEFDLLISKAEQAIQFMQERRTALISAAVTGKIDVRDWQAPNLTEPEQSA